jgi:tetratricopeptide (TPR) repeat protein
MKIVSFLLLLVSFSLSAQTDFEKGEILFNQKKFSEAKVYLKMSPNNYKSIELLGDVAGQQKNWNEAIKQYKILKNQFPKEANYWYKYGGALGMKAKDSNKFKALGMLDEVESCFLTAAKLDAKHIETRWALVIYYIQIPGILGGSEKKSQKYANELMAISAVDGYFANGYIAEYFKRYAAAEKFYIKANEIEKSAKTYQKLYDLYANKLKDSEKLKKMKENETLITKVNHTAG